MRPIESIKASPNAGKTTAVKIQKLLYDPHVSFGSLVKTWGSGKSDDRRDRFVSASSQAFIVFDNVKRATIEEQDDLCQMATGGASSTRKLRTDAELHTLEIQTNVAYTSVNDIATFPDLIRRQIQFKLAQGEIEVNEDALFDSLLKNRPKILHYIFTTLATAQALLEKRDTNKYCKKHRGLWKFVIVGDAIAEAMGHSENFVSNLFEEVPLIQAQRAIENDSFGAAFVRWIINSRETCLELTANEIKIKVEKYCEKTTDITDTNDYGWPTSAKAVCQKLEYFTQAFKELGIIVERRGKLKNGYLHWIITKQLDNEAQRKNGDNNDDGSSGDCKGSGYEGNSDARVTITYKKNMQN